MRLKQFWVGFLLVAVSPMLHGQDTATKLTGTWQLNIEKSNPVKKPFRPATLTITCVGNKVQFVFWSEGEENKEQYVTNGKEQIASLTHDVEKVVKASWRDGVLVIEIDQRGRNPKSGPGAYDVLLGRATEFWSLSPDGQTLKHEIDMSVSRRVPDKSKRIAIYDKAQSPTPN